MNDDASKPAAVIGPLSADELRLVDAWWRAANYLSVGQIYLLDNPLLKQPLELRHIQPRLLGHWGTTPGLNFVYVHLNRAIRRRDLNAIYVCGPGHGGPGMVTYFRSFWTGSPSRTRSAALPSTGSPAHSDRPRRWMTVTA